ncbi:MAG: hypothetical protein QXF07_01785 [Candidatus Micrarchaeia archaeon]
MAIEGAALIETLLVLGAGYFVISTLLPRVRKDVLTRFISDEATLNTIVYIVSLWIIASVTHNALNAFTGMLDTDGQRYISALASPIGVISGEISKLFSLMVLGAYLFIAYSILSYSKKGRD